MTVSQWGQISHYKDYCIMQNKTLHEIDMNKWKHDLSNQPKLRTYMLFKNEYKCENYVSMILPKSLRSFIAQIRCGVLPLRIETGRFRNLAVGDRICTFCNLNEIESEIHFCFVCPVYVSLRLLFYNSIDRLCPEFINLDYANKFKKMFTDKKTHNKECHIHSKLFSDEK